MQIRTLHRAPASLRCCRAAGTAAGSIPHWVLAAGPSSAKGYGGISSAAGHRSTERVWRFLRLLRDLRLLGDLRLLRDWPHLRLESQRQEYLCQASLFLLRSKRSDLRMRPVRADWLQAERSQCCSFAIATTPGRAKSEAVRSWLGKCRRFVERCLQRRLQQRQPQQRLRARDRQFHQPFDRDHREGRFMPRALPRPLGSVPLRKSR
jgi:hypothetical protein